MAMGDAGRIGWTGVMAVRVLEQRTTTRAKTQPVRVLFLNTRESLGADVAVHLAVARGLDRSQTQVWAATNIHEVPGEPMLAAFAQIPELTLEPVDFGQPMGGGSRVQSLLRSARGAMSIAQLAVLCRREKIDIIHVTERPRDALFGLMLARAAGSKCLMHAHTSYYGHDSGRLTNWTLRHVDGVVGVSRFTASTYVQSTGLPPERVYGVHNAVDSDIFTPPATPEARIAIRERFGVAPDAQLIGCVARLMRWKGQTDLLKAFAVIRQTHPGARLLLAGTSSDDAPEGGGDFRDYLDRDVERLGLGDAVIFTGFLPYDEMPAVFGALDVVAHPAVEEPFGLAVVEAMACERPVVAVHGGGVPEIIRDEVDGLLVSREAPDELAAALLRVLGDHELAARLGRAGRRRVVNHFSPQRQAEVIAEVYRQVVKRNPRDS